MEYLSLTASGPHQNNIICDLSKAITDVECNIVDSRMTMMGADIGIIMLVSGTWNEIAKLETHTQQLEETLNIKIHVNRTKLAMFEEKLLPYLIQVIALDAPGLIHQFSQFCVAQNAVIYDLQTNTFNAVQSETTMLSLMISLGVPSEINLSDLRERFLILCDELNVDGMLEPEKR